MSELCSLLKSESPSHRTLTEILDGMEHAKRVSVTQRMPRVLLGRLYDVMADAPPLSLEAFVPSHVPPLQPVWHFGANSLPKFRAFEKPMFRLPDGTIAGRNTHSWALATGPGYFVLEPSAEPERGAVQLNYERLPSAVPQGWPRARENTRGLGALVFGGVVDYVRRVSSHVCVGRAVRHGETMDTYFVLVRDPCTDAAASAEARLQVA